jgi:hypothetical protein
MSKLTISGLAIAGLLLLSGMVYAAGELSTTNMMNTTGTACAMSGTDQNNTATQCSMTDGKCPMTSGGTCPMMNGTDKATTGKCNMMNGMGKGMNGKCAMMNSTGDATDKKAACH